MKRNGNFTKLLKFSKVLIILIPLAGHAQTRNEAGRPFITNYTPKQYGAHPQNYAIVQDQYGVMYFANGNGVLEHDGVTWRLISLPTNSYTQSLAIASGPDEIIYTGGQGELGYLAPDSIGQMRFVSLLDHVEPEDRLYVNVWNTYVTSHGVYFQGFNHLFRWSNDQASNDRGKLQVWKSKLRYLSSFVIRDRLYLHQSKVGLLQMMGDSLQLVRGGERFADDRIDAMLPYDERRILIATRSQGLYLFDGSVYQPFKTAADAFLLENQLFRGALSPDGSFALATMRGAES